MDGIKYRWILTTLEARQLYDNFPNDKFIVEDLHIDDIIIISDSEGNTYQWQGGTVEKVYNSLLGYLEACIERKS